ncbi:protein kinase rad3 [Apiospora saccharicola]
MRIELAPNGWAACQDSQCQMFEYKIPQGALRFGTWVELPFMTCCQWKWKHWGCVSGKQLQNLQAAIYSGNNEGGAYDWAKIEGFDELVEFPEVQARIRRVVAQGHIDDADFNGEPLCNTPGRIGIRRRGTITPSPVKVGPIIIPLVPVPIALALDRATASPFKDEPGISPSPSSKPHPVIKQAASGHAGNKPTFIITGMFSAMTQDEAQAMVMSIGGTVESNRSETTSYAVVGAQPALWKVARFKTHGTRMLNEEEFLEFIIRKGNVKPEDGNGPVQSTGRSEKSDSIPGIKKEEEKQRSDMKDLVKKEEGAEDPWEGLERGERKVAAKEEESSITLAGTNAHVEDYRAGNPTIKSETIVLVKKEETDDIVFLTAPALNTRKRSHAAGYDEDDDDDDKKSEPATASSKSGRRATKRFTRIQKMPVGGRVLPQAGQERGIRGDLSGEGGQRNGYRSSRGYDNSNLSGPRPGTTSITAITVGLRRSTRNKAPPT